MKKSIKTIIWVGLDVHKKGISVCWYEGDSQAEEFRAMGNSRGEIKLLFGRLRRRGEVRACYEAGPCGYEVRRVLSEMGIHCDVIAPSLIPKMAGDRVKTDRKDARKLARLYRAGELTLVRVPTEQEEAARDLVRCREDLREDAQRARHRLLKFMLRRGRIWTQGKNWTLRHWRWLRQQKFKEMEAQRTFEEYVVQLETRLDRQGMMDQELNELAQREPWKAMVDRLRSLKGFDTLSALIVAVEVVDFRRFRSPRELAAYLGVTPTLYASGEKSVKGRITKCGNRHVRRVLTEASWSYARPVQPAERIRQRTEGQPPWVHDVAVKAQHRLHMRYRRLLGRGKRINVANVAVTRELAGFIWALMVGVPARRTGSPPDRESTRSFVLTGRVNTGKKAA